MYLQFPDYVGGHDLADEYLSAGDPGADDDDEDGNPNRGASVGYDWHLGGWMGGGKCNDDCAKAFDGICSDPDSRNTTRRPPQRTSAPGRRRTNANRAPTASTAAGRRRRT